MTLRLWQTIRGWCSFEPIRHARWEQVFLRAGIVWVSWGLFYGDSAYQTQPHPNGIAQWMDLTFLSNDATEAWLRPLAQYSLLLFVAGVPAVLSLLAPMLAGIGFITLKNSQGAIGHTFQVMHLCLLAIWLGSLWGWIRKARGCCLPRAFTPWQLELDWARQALAATYVVSALTKLFESGGLWFRDSQYFALHLIKNTDMKYYDTLEPGSQQLESLPDLMMQHPLFSQLFFGLALPLELFAFLGCFNRRLALVFGLSLVGFHLCVKQLTLLDFEYNIQLLVILMVNPAWWLVMAAMKLLGNKRETRAM